MIIKSSVHVSECDSVRMCECTHGEVPVVAAGPPPLPYPPCVRSFAAAKHRFLPSTAATSGK